MEVTSELTPCTYLMVERLLSGSYMKLGGTYTMEVTLHTTMEHGSYLIERTPWNLPWKLPSGIHHGTYHVHHGRYLMDGSYLSGTLQLKLPSGNLHHGSYLMERYHGSYLMELTPLPSGTYTKEVT